MKPCVRNLPGFKKGCPENDTCPCWKTLQVAKRGNPLEKEIKSQCIDLWMFEFAWSQLGATEAVQKEIEELRNNLCQGGGMPKPDPALVELVQIIRKRLSDGNTPELGGAGEYISE
ncbi:MAG: hypothetical protein SWH61_05245 [Thermodesulfobacteriota bacterium]|nr:hypothetical protein [Thermodesulfobacteriota bacterium]